MSYNIYFLGLLSIFSLIIKAISLVVTLFSAQDKIFKIQEIFFY